LNHLNSQRSTGEIVVFYPGDSLRQQIAGWKRRHPEYTVEVSLAKSLPRIRSMLRRAGAVLFDATADPARATDAFSQAVARLGPSGVAVYTETMHPWLELFVRTRGALLLLGPMSEAHWDGLFEGMLCSRGTAQIAALVTQRPERKPARAGKGGQRATRTASQWSFAGFRRPKTGVK
jgi:hypothetical protein